MKVSRRQAIRLLSGGLGAGLAAREWLSSKHSRARGAQAKQALNLSLQGFTLGIHVPAIVGALELFPATYRYPPPRMTRIARIQTMSEMLIAGTTDIVQTEPPTILRATESGADLKIVGNVYVNADLVYVANSERVGDLQDLEKPGVTVAVESKNGVTYVMLVGALLKHGGDPRKLTVLEVGGSGARMKALLSKRVDVVPIHFDQAKQVMAQGHFNVLIEPWKEYKTWINEVWAVNGAWLRRPGSQQAVVDFMKAGITAFRRGDKDLVWYTAGYRKYVTLPGAHEATQAQLKPLWLELVNTVKAWPPSDGFGLDVFHDLLPAYKAAGAIAGTVKLEQVVDTSFVERALKELGR